VFERFTERARQVVVIAQEEARALTHDRIGTEHLLLGLCLEEEGLAARALGSVGVTADGVREQVARIVGTGEPAPTGQIPFTPRAKKVLELSLREALGLSHNYIGTEHVLLGLVREGDGVAIQILADLGAEAQSVREATLAMLADEAPPPRRLGRRQRGWEYHVVPVGATDALTEDLLAPLGAARWELVAVVGAPGELRAVFKRPA
jgi:ATP-dependent Clp protease ATP-binding subunit ClpC